jgi:hypothetical protein
VIEPGDVTAVLVTRGDQPEMIRRIQDSLIFDDVLVWDNSVRPDRKTAGRYWALDLGTRHVVYFQDDDVIVPADTQRRLVQEYMPGVVIANYGHGENDGGYGDLPLVCGGAVLDCDLPWAAANRYFEHYPLDEDFLPFEIEMPVAQHPSRLCNQPWAADMKLRVTEQARQVRDMVTA